MYVSLNSIEWINDCTNDKYMTEWLTALLNILLSKEKKQSGCWQMSNGIVDKHNTQTPIDICDKLNIKLIGKGIFISMDFGI